MTFLGLSDNKLSDITQALREKAEADARLAKEMQTELGAAPTEQRLLGVAGSEIEAARQAKKRLIDQFVCQADKNRKLADALDEMPDEVFAQVPGTGRFVPVERLYSRCEACARTGARNCKKCDGAGYRGLPVLE